MTAKKYWWRCAKCGKTFSTRVPSPRPICACGSESVVSISEGKAKRDLKARRSAE